ncbi:hypothetical protein E2C01_058437 [Portunus trituberculatus]|uniref:Uncharacterized protein n=1 Tax=Portunus trituberculatus TaxID=210409 RepID=A0A5B7H366_PORTR|nr:hypothetical protein [Portunus trituberculatus]
MLLKVVRSLIFRQNKKVVKSEKLVRNKNHHTLQPVQVVTLAVTKGWHHRRSKARKQEEPTV